MTYEDFKKAYRGYDFQNWAEFAYALDKCGVTDIGRQRAYSKWRRAWSAKVKGVSQASYNRTKRNFAKGGKFKDWRGVTGVET